MYSRLLFEWVYMNFVAFLNKIGLTGNSKTSTQAGYPIR